jgi:hypothetical protein
MGEPLTSVRYGWGLAPAGRVWTLRAQPPDPNCCRSLRRMKSCPQNHCGEHPYDLVSHNTNRPSWTAAAACAG